MAREDGRTKTGRTLVAMLNNNGSYNCMRRSPWSIHALVPANRQ
jgi:hypothetical protein